jgi:hypothetical protein
MTHAAADHSALLSSSYMADLNTSNILGHPRQLRLGKAAGPISSVQMAKDVYRKEQTASQSSSRVSTNKIYRRPT